MTRLLLIRHGHVDGISLPRFRGRRDLALSGRGILEAQAVAKRLAAVSNLAAIYSSPLSRCMHVAGAIAETTGTAVQASESLNDLDYGDWEWKTHLEVEQEEPAAFQMWHERPHLIRFPGGEALQDLVARTADAIRLAMVNHPDSAVVMVGHDSVNRALLLQVLEQPLSAYWRITQSPCCINEIEIVGRHVHVLRVNETSHLDHLDSQL